MKQFNIEMYTTQEGRTPVIDWFESQKDKKTIARIEARLARIRSGNLGDHKSLGEGVFELRLDFGTGYRIYFARIESRILLLLCGGDKSSQNEDIERARRNYHDYIKRRRARDS